MIISKKIKITGKVQGVFFRASAKIEAEKLHLTGWVQNTADESVEACVQGKELNVLQFIEWCKKGPSAAEVKNITVADCPETSMPGFMIRR